MSDHEAVSPVEVVPAPIGRETRNVKHRAGRWLPTFSELADEAKERGIDPEPFEGNRKVLWLAIQGARLYSTGARGMKPILDLDLIDAICEHVENGAPMYRAAGACGVSTNAIVDWKGRGEADPDSIYGLFFSKIQMAEDKAICALLKRVRDNEKNWRGSAWILERRFTKEFGRPAPIFVQAHQQGEAPNLSDLLKALTGGEAGEVRLVAAPGHSSPDRALPEPEATDVLATEATEADEV